MKCINNWIEHANEEFYRKKNKSKFYEKNTNLIKKLLKERTQWKNDSKIWFKNMIRKYDSKIWFNRKKSLSSKPIWRLKKFSSTKFFKMTLWFTFHFLINLRS